MRQVYYVPHYYNRFSCTVESGSCLVAIRLSTVKLLDEPKKYVLLAESFHIMLFMGQ